MNESMISNAEQLLLTTLQKIRDIETFDDYRVEQYHDSNCRLDFSKLVCCSTSNHEHIKRAYYHSMEWYTAATPLSSYPDPKDYGYELNESGLLVPQILGALSRPEDMPPPCSCKKCNRQTCKCKAVRWKCSKFCNCSKFGTCENPYN